jgi:endonuclease YncB( thermonuclease family)
VGTLGSSPESNVVVPAGFTWTFPARIIRWVDGDSAWVDIARTSLEELHGIEVRIDGINAVELKTAFGPEAKAFMESLAPAGAAVMLVERNHREKYGRELARVLLPDGRDLGIEILTAKASDGTTPLAVPYNP